MTPAVEAFIHCSRRYEQARRFSDRVGAQGNRAEIENAIAAKQEVEQEISECFVLVRRPPSMGGAR